MGEDFHLTFFILSFLIDSKKAYKQPCLWKMFVKEEKARLDMIEGRVHSRILHASKFQV